MKELCMTSIMMQYYVLVRNCLLALKIISQKKLFLRSKKFCWMKSVIKFFCFAFGITFSCVRDPNFVWICVEVV